LIPDVETGAVSWVSDADAIGCSDVFVVEIGSSFVATGASVGADASTVSTSTLTSGYVSRVLMKTDLSATYRPNHAFFSTHPLHTNPSKSS
jgi:hypothetical protein